MKKMHRVVFTLWALHIAISHVTLQQAWVKKGSSEGLRPTLPEDADPAYVALLETVWTEDPLQRPSFTHLLKQLEAQSPQRGDLMDNLVSMVMTGVTNSPKVSRHLNVTYGIKTMNYKRIEQS